MSGIITVFVFVCRYVVYVLNGMRGCWSGLGLCGWVDKWLGEEA